jgi:hypothetical protein
MRRDLPPGQGSLQELLTQPTAVDTLRALRSYYAAEDSLTTLQRIEFTTSRYRTFSEQLAPAVAQSNNAAMRRYPTPINPQAWLNDPANNDQVRLQAMHDYLTVQQALAALAENFDPMADDLPPHLPSPGKRNDSTVGESGLLALRKKTENAWQTFAATVSSSFDRLIPALGRPDLASQTNAPRPPETELSVFVDSTDVIVALLLESPEPLPWRRLWQWVRFVRLAFFSLPMPLGVTVLWSADGTRGLVVPIGPANGLYTLSIELQGNIGAEVPSITSSGTVVKERVSFAPITLANLNG